MFLLGIKYDGFIGKCVMQFIDNDGKLVLINDPYNHLPYFYTKDLDVPDYPDISFSLEKLYDKLQRKDVVLRKVTCRKPTDVIFLRQRVNTAWETDIKYTNLWLADNGITPSIDYNDNIEPNIVNISDDYLENLMGQPIPKVPVSAIDIEVLAHEFMPSPLDAKFPINCISLVTPVNKTVLILSEECPNIPGAVVLNFNSERALIRYAFAEIRKWPLWVTFNGAGFDLIYLYNRASQYLGFIREDIPIQRTTFIRAPNGDPASARLVDQIHIDLYNYYHNPTIQNYVYSARYKYYGLDDIALAMLGRGKNKNGKTPADMTAFELGTYCLNDSQLTYDLVDYNNQELIRILVSLSRISKMPIEDIASWGTNQWVKSMLVWEHKIHNYLIPNREDLAYGEESATVAIIKGKKYKGATVLHPKKGLHFDVKVLDAASLYPTIISKYNMSYETVNCPHDECHNNKIPDTPYWFCGKEKGIISKLIGDLRDLRVNKIKPRAKSDPFWESVSQGVKTILNATYGVMGFHSFSMYYLPMAESITAIGRYVIDSCVSKAKELGMTVLFGDTDSIGLKGNKIKELQDWASKELEIDLELDKEYKWLALTDRKKNYLGMPKKGDKLVIKGLQGKKVHTPTFVTSKFNDLLDYLKTIDENIGVDKTHIKSITSEGITNLINKQYPLDAYEFRMIVKRESYKTESVNSKTGKTRKVKKPMHIRALEKLGQSAQMGRVVRFIKTINGPEPIETANISNIDIMAYIDIYKSSLEQVLDALDIDFLDMCGLPVIRMIKPIKKRKALNSGKTINKVGSLKGPSISG